MIDLRFPTDMTSGTRPTDDREESHSFRELVPWFESGIAPEPRAVRAYEDLKGTYNHRWLRLALQLAAAVENSGTDSPPALQAAREFLQGVEAQFTFAGWMGSDLLSAYLDYDFAAACAGYRAALRMQNLPGRRLARALQEWFAHSAWVLRHLVEGDRMLSAQLRSRNDGREAGALGLVILDRLDWPPTLAAKWRRTGGGEKTSRWQYVGMRWVQWLVEDGGRDLVRSWYGGDGRALPPQLKVSVRYPLALSTGRAGSEFRAVGGLPLPPPSAEPKLREGRVERPVLVTREARQDVSPLYELLPPDIGRTRGWRRGPRPRRTAWIHNARPEDP